MQTHTFKREFIMDEILDSEAVRINEPFKQHQYFTEFLLIFEFEDKFWQTIYHRGIGENGELPFEYAETIDCSRVWPQICQSVEYVTEDPALAVSV